MIKDYYLRTFCDKLNAAGYKYYDSSDVTRVQLTDYYASCDAVAQLRYLPEENLEKIASYEVEKHSNFNALYQALGKCGYLKFRPYVFKSDGGTKTLCLRHNRFLQLRPDGKFKLTENPDDKSVLRESTYDVHDILHNEYEKPTQYDSHLVYMLIYSTLIDCGFYVESFRDVFYGDTKVVDEFLDSSLHVFDIKYSYGFHDIFDKYISYRKGNVAFDKVAYEVVNSSDYIMCRFTIEPGKIAVEYCPDSLDCIGSSRVVEVTLPNWTEGLPDDVKPIAVIHSPLGELLRNNGLLNEKKILSMLLKFVGVNVSGSTPKSIRNIGYISTKVSDKLVRFRSYTDFVD